MDRSVLGAQFLNFVDVYLIHLRFIDVLIEMALLMSRKVVLYLVIVASEPILVRVKSHVAVAPNRNRATADLAMNLTPYSRASARRMQISSQMTG